jgi:alpha-tubulin suppressor-like RCC1 family protein/subtilisin family serine protease
LLFVSLLVGVALLVPRVSHGMRAAGDENPVAPTRTEAKKAGGEFVPGEILVRFRAETIAKQDASGQRVARMSLRSGADGQEILARVERLGEDAEFVAGLRLARVQPEETLEAVSALRARADVLYAEPNYRRYRTAAPNDSRYAELWGLNNTGQAGGVAGADIKAETAWNTTTGSRDFVVAVIDEGVDVNHTDLAPNIWRNAGEVPRNNTDDDGNGFTDDYNGYDFFHNDGSVYDGPGANPDGSTVDAHGTHVAGTIGAVGNNGVGVAGVNWQASIMSLKILGPDGGSVADAIRAYAYARMMRELWQTTGGARGANIRVTNNSYGGDRSSQAETDAIRALNDAGILFVAAAGNEREDNNIVPSFPASCDLPNVISVASLDRRNNVSNFSNFGSRTVQLAAPGSEILSTLPGNGYGYLSGTSMASPHVAGAAALVLAAHPEFNVARLRAALLFGGEAQATLDAYISTGRRLNAAGALENAGEADSTPPAAPSGFRIGAQDGRFITLNWTAPGDDGMAGRAALQELRFNDAATATTFLLAVQRPAAAGTAQSLSVRVPYRHPSGTFTLRVTDNAGNASEASVNVNAPEEDVNPYSVVLGAPQPLSTGGTRLGAAFDDHIASAFLPFSFPFYDRFYTSAQISTNGAIYLKYQQNNDPFSLRQALDGRVMIAGLWDDLDLRTCMRADSDVYVVRPPENDRIIYRWQGVRFTNPSCPQTPNAANPVNFEIELRRDGTIIKRYGDNPRVAPVVGLGSGEPEGYYIASHSGGDTAPISLSNAQTVTYTLRRPPTAAELELTGEARPNPILVGENLTYTLRPANRGPGRAFGVLLTHTLPPEGDLVSCETTRGSCSVGADGKILIEVGTLDVNATATVKLVVRIARNPSSTVDSTTVISAQTFDPSASNNTFHGFTQVTRPNQNPQTGLVAVSAGGDASFAIRADGYGLAWGANFSGQLGDGSRTQHPLPVRIGEFNPISFIDAGYSHTLALKPDGTLWAWGNNSGGALGDGTSVNRPTPTQVNGLAGVVHAAAGSVHSLAVKSDGTVWAWGVNGNGQLGDGTTTNRSTPVQVPGLTNVKLVAAGLNHSLALKRDGTVWAWGNNDDGQLGDGTQTQRLAPVQVSGLSNIVAIDAAGDNVYAERGSFSVALRSDGTVWAWGNNASGQLSDGTLVDRSTPVQIPGLLGVKDVAAGWAHVIALKTDGTVWAWGKNRLGQLGDGTNFDHSTPAPVIWLSGVVAIDAGFEHNLALRQDGQVLGWGSYSQGQLGFGGTVGSLLFPFAVSKQLPDPPPIATLPPPTFNPNGGYFNAPQNVTIRNAVADALIVNVAPGFKHTIVQVSDGKFYAWGAANFGQLMVDPATLPPLTQSVPTATQLGGLLGTVALASGSAHSLALRGDGTVLGWGHNFFYQAGAPDNGYSNLHVPKLIAGLTSVSAISADGNRSLALKSDGTVWAWGEGSGTNGFGGLPAQVPGLSGMVAVEAGNRHSMALRSDGTVWTWGANESGQLGNGASGDIQLTPVQVSNLGGVKAIAGGGGHSLALKTDGTVWAWGNNVGGQLGLGGNDNVNRSTPVQVPGLGNITAIGAGLAFNVALAADGTLWVWGSNNNGELGDGTYQQHRAPVQLNTIKGVRSITIQGESAFALKTDGTVWAWGANDQSQLGDRTSDSQSSPVQITQLTGATTIRYTTDGSEPTEASPTVASGGTITIERNTTLKARAWKSGWTPSIVKAATYNIGGGGQSIVEFGAAGFTADEATRSASVNITRTGDTSGTALIRLITLDDPAAVPCNVSTGTAYARCDYATTVAQVEFAPGETERSVSIPLFDDAYAEPDEAVELFLDFPFGATVGRQDHATLTIKANAARAENPIYGTPFFVRQQYLDFLSREPEAGEPWSNVLNRCSDVNNNPLCDRATVSAAFYRSPEFQLKGSYVFRFYTVTLGELPTYNEITRDMASVTGATPEEVFQKKANFAEAWPRHGRAAEVFDTYSRLGPPGTIVFYLTSRNYNLPQITTIDPANPDGTRKVVLTREELTRAYETGALSLGQVVRAIADSDEVAAAEYYRAFVAMQYYGYLRRDPEPEGFNNWLNYLKANPNDFRTMVKGFANSVEYRLRFGQP